MLITKPLYTSPLRDNITNAYRMDEAECINQLIPWASFSEESLAKIQENAKQLVIDARQNQKKQGKVNLLLNKYDLSTEEGIALMCLAEALLRIPDKETMDKFISDKLSTVEWKNHLSKSNPFFVNAATWSLLLSGKIYAPTLSDEKNLLSSLKRTGSRLGIAMLRPIIMKMMKAVGNQFVLGETIEQAIKNSAKLEEKGYHFSYDMLGEAARTEKGAQHYYNEYEKAIEAIGKLAKSNDVTKNNGISVKLSALHPRYEYTQRERVLTELTPLVLKLAQLAKKYNITLVVDAEEADRLDLSLDIFENVYTDSSLSGWEGLGLALQAYQKRAFYIIDWLSNLVQHHEKRIVLRLVKGAYWDTEIKISQVQGFSGYPVFTRKHSTDISYLACAKKILSRIDSFYPQFGTHNAYSIAAIMEMAGPRNFEFQCLYGMGQPMYDGIIDRRDYTCRIYAPVGTHQDLLGYLVRRLLENGANTSFLNLIADENAPLDKIITDPATRISKLTQKSHPRIPLPKNMYREWENSQGIDLSNTHQLLKLKDEMDEAAQETWSVASLIDGKLCEDTKQEAVTSPSSTDRIIGYASSASKADIKQALQTATRAAKSWSLVPLTERAKILENAATLFQKEMPRLMTVLTKEGGKCILDCMSEVRETIDYCRYYAYRARKDLSPTTLPGPAGESNQLFLHPRGLITCISPWNFPLAIFTGQVIAALVAGNTVIAKPAEQTPIIAFKAVEILHRAGIPKEVLQLTLGDGKVGAQLVEDPRVAGIMFTGSTETAKLIEQTLANREGPIALFIAETGGQNAMIVDSTTLPEQAIIDIVQSAFNSAGQRCSALRVLFVQNEIAPKLMDLLKGFMAELTLGDPSLLATDVGPVIDSEAQAMLKKHIDKMNNEAKLIAQAKADNLSGYFIPPCAYELSDLSILKREVFGPILHVIRYQARDLDKILNAIIKTGYGLTLGVNSRIDATIRYVVDQMPVGNIYVNRNMIGAVVGVQPFGGERLSGTGPKAGGPHYLPRLCVERSVSINTAALGGDTELVSLHEEDE